MDQAGMVVEVGHCMAKPHTRERFHGSLFVPFVCLQHEPKNRSYRVIFRGRLAQLESDQMVYSATNLKTLSAFFPTLSVCTSHRFA